MITVSDLSASELEFSGIRASGPGGQNVNKTSSAVHLRFDIQASSLPDWIKERLMQLGDRRVTADGIVVIKSQMHRSQDRNRREAIERLDELLGRAQATRKVRHATRPGRAAVARRLARKGLRSERKKFRKPVRDWD